MSAQRIRNLQQVEMISDVSIPVPRRRLSGGQRRNRVGRVQDVRCYQDQQLGPLLPLAPALEERPQDRDVAEDGDLVDRLFDAAVEQAADGQRLAVGQLDLRVHPPSPEARNQESGNGQAVGEVQRRHLWRHAQPDVAGIGDGRNEVQPNPELLPHDRDRVAVAALDSRKRELTAGQKRRFLAFARDEVRFRQASEVSGALEQPNDRVEPRIVSCDHQVHEAPGERLDHVLVIPLEPFIQPHRVGDADQLAADLFYDRARDLGELHMQEDLLGRRRLDVVDDLRAGRVRQFQRSSHHGRIAHRSREDNRRPRRRDDQVDVGEQVPQLPLQRCEVGGHFDREDLYGLVAAPKDEAGGADRLRVHNELTRRDDHGLGHRGVRDQHTQQRVGHRDDGRRSTLNRDNGVRGRPNLLRPSTNRDQESAVQQKTDQGSAARPH